MLKRVCGFSRTFAFILLFVFACANLFLISTTALSAELTPTPVEPKWKTGVWADPDFFPIAVWLQNPVRAEAYRKAGFNTYVGLWEGPTEEQLAALKQAGMRLICDQNETALRHRDDPNIIGWMHGDEPDNAQSLGRGKGYGPPVLPEKIVGDYRRIQAADPTRPVMLNLGQGVAWDNYVGRGVRRNHPEDYPEYMKGSDIVSFDIYPVVHENPEIAGKLWYVPRGVDRLIQWSEGRKTVWNCIECTHIENPNRKATPQQVKAEVWMSLIHGSRGLIYFVHQFKPTFREPALLDDPEMVAAVTAINRQITELAPVLNSPTLKDAATVKSENAETPVDIMVKRDRGTTYLFAVGMREGATTATFSLPGNKGQGTVEVIGENRTLKLNAGAFTDRFDFWGVHLYRLTEDGK